MSDTMSSALRVIPTIVDGVPGEARLSTWGLTLTQGPALPWDKITRVRITSGGIRLFHQPDGGQARLDLSCVPGRFGLTSDRDAVTLREEVEHYWLAGRLANIPSDAKEATGPARPWAERWGLLAVAAKLGPKLLGLLGKLGAGGVKIGLASATFAGFSFLYSWQFAVLLMGMLFVHEYGHVFAMKRSGMKVKGIYYIPFLGAVSVSEDAWPSRRAQAYVALQGPLWGAILSLLALMGYFVTGRQHANLGVLAAWWGVINLFNLIPMNPLDGGRLLSAVAASVHRTAGIAIIALFMALAILLAFLLRLNLIWILGGIGLLEMWSHRKSRRLKPAYESFLKDLDTQGMDITPFNSRDLMKRLATELGLGRFKQNLLLQGLKSRFKRALKVGSAESARTAFHETVSTTLNLKAPALQPTPEMSAGQIGLYSGYYVALVLLLSVIIGIGALIGQQDGKAAFEILK